MKKNVKRIVSLILASVMLLGMTGCKPKNAASTGPRAEAYEYLNTDGTLPIVKEGYEKTLKIAIQMYSDSGEAESQWFYQFIENEMNINLEIQKLSGSEQISLLLADGDLFKATLVFPKAE